MLSVSIQGSILALLTLLAGGANLTLVWAVNKHRHQIGGTWFVVVAALMTTICFGYGVALLLVEPVWLREVFEAVTLIFTLWLGVAWLVFALVYTGRRYVLRTSLATIGALTAVGVTALVLTNGYHELVWSDFQLAPLDGAATVAYDRGIGYFTVFFFGSVLLAAAQILLLDTLISYGPLFRSQVVALLLTPIFPMIGIVAYTFGVGPYAQFNLLPVLLVPHMILDIYALFSAEMFEFNPATRRVGERTAIDDLDTPVVTVDLDGHIISFNSDATTFLGNRRRQIIGKPIDERLSTSIELDRPEQDTTILVGGKRRQYRVTVSPFDDVTGTRLGYTIVFQDITDLRQREQQFSVVNRVLRHNLRNDLTVISGHAEMIASMVDDRAIVELVETITDESDQLLELAERARELDRTADRTSDTDQRVELRPYLLRLVSEYSEAAEISVDVSADIELRTDPDVLGLVLGNLLDNAVEYGTSAQRTATETDGGRPAQISVRAFQRPSNRESVWIEVSDDGPGIPDQEIEPLRDGGEDALRHGSGLGLWVVQSGVTALGGDLSFSTSPENGTTVTVRVPGRVNE